MGDTVSFTITVCSHNGGQQSIALLETLPDTSVFTFISSNPSFPYFTSFPADTCLSYTVKGKYKTVGNCPSQLLQNKVSLQTSGSTVYRDSVCVTVVEDACRANLTIANNTYSQSLGTGYTGQSIFIAGIFYVNNTFTFNNCSVYTAPTAQIIIQAGGFLVLNGTTIEGCRYMWAGIEVLNGGKINLGGSTIKDAAAGITLRNGGNAKVVNSYFYDDIIGIDAQPEISQSDVYGNAALTVTGSTFRALNGYRPVFSGSPTGINMYIGIRLNKMFCTIGDNAQTANTFTRSIHGIFANYSDLKVTNSYFNFISNNNSWPGSYRGTCVVSLGANTNFQSKLKLDPMANGSNTVDACDRGVYSNYSQVDINYVKFIDVNTGIFTAHCQNRKANVSNCTIKASKYGINWMTNAGAYSMNASYNVITIQGSTQGVGISLIETVNSVSGNYVIVNNTVTLNAAALGVYGSYASKVQINYNTISQLKNGVIKPATTGISLLGGDSATVSCNYISTNYPSDSSFVSKGIEVAQSRQFTVNCNTIKHHNCGVYLGGNCLQQNNFRANKVDSCDMGLYLNTSAVIGQQTQRGNKWLGALNKLNASNVGNPVFSKIFIHQTSNTIWHPLNYSPNGQWFFVDTLGSPDQCGVSCLTQHSQDLDVNLLKNIALDSALTKDFVDESKNIAKQYLYNLLDEDSILRNSDVVFLNFYTANQVQAYGKFNASVDFVKAAFMGTAYFSHLLATTENLIQQTKDSLLDVDRLAEINIGIDYSILKQQLFQTLHNYESTMQSVVLQIENLKYDNLQNSKNINATITPTETPEINSKTMDDIVGEAELNGIENAAYRYAEALAIALQCPYSGGTAVYQARNFVAWFNDSLIYNDEAMCLQAGLYRKGGINTQNYTAIDFELIPNPTNDKTEIRILSPVNAITKVTLRNMLGQIMDEWKPEGQQQFTIYTHKYLQGFYLIDAKGENGFNKIKKLIIEK